MKLKTYQAYSMAVALAAVKNDLGADAVILSTRSFKRGGILGIGRRTVVEVTASPAQRPASLLKAGAAVVKSNSDVRRPARSVAAQKSYAGAAAPGAPVATAKNVPRKPAIAMERNSANDDRQRTQRLAMAMVEKHERSEPRAMKDQALPAGKRSHTVSMESSSTAMMDPPKPQAAMDIARAALNPSASRDERRNFAVKPVSSAGATASPPIISVPVPAAKRFILTLPEKANGVKPIPNELFDSGLSTKPRVVATTNGAAVARPQAATENVAIAGEMQEELSAIKAMVGQVLHRQASMPTKRSAAMPAKLFDIYLKLIGQDLPDELAEEITASVRNVLSPPELDDPQIIKREVGKTLAGFVRDVDGSLKTRSADGRPLTIALIGPTGVGKTTTLAKLAAMFKLQHNCKVGLITSDTYRIAAVDQLRTYANIIGLPLQVVLTPQEMQQAVHALRECDVILVDTAGRSQNDELRLAELRQFIAAAGPHEVHLVLSSTASEKVLTREAEAFGQVGVDKIVLTKLDEAVSFGPLISLLKKIERPLSFITTGQEVPHHIEIGRGQRLAELALGGTLRA